MYAATYMCTSSCQKFELRNRASTGWTSTARPSSRRKPVGWFIQPLTEITMTEPRKPAITIGIPLAKCTHGRSRFQP